MKRSLSVFTVLFAFLIVSAVQSKQAAASDMCSAQAGTTVKFDGIKITHSAIRRDIARLAMLRVAVDDGIPMVCQDTFRFCVAGCTSSSPPSCITGCTADLKQCIKDVAPLAEAEVD